jgi:hypothetical protein
MTFRVTEYDPVAPWYSPEAGYVTNLEGFVGVIGTSADLLVERVGFEGAPGSTWSGRNYEEGPFFLGLSGDQPLTGTFKVVSSRIRDAEINWHVWAVRNAQVTIGGSPSDGNMVENGAIGGEYLDLDTSVFEYSYNNVAVSPWMGLFIWQGALFLPQGPTQFLIQHNTFKVTGGYVYSIWAVDFGPPSGWGKTADFMIRDNTIWIAGSDVDPAAAGVDVLFAVGAVISNNRIRGENVLAGIAAEGSSECMLLGNNVQQLDALLAPVALLTADWGWGPMATSYCTVVGGSNKTNVYDEGTGNVLVGVNNMQGYTPGPAIRDAMKRKMEIIKSMRKP